VKCPNDSATLLISDKQGVEIDYCPECRGVWLDRGELDKLIERSDVVQQPAPSPARQHYDQTDRRYDHNDDHHYKKKKKESFLGDLFDF
jgi:uncharacterized protein